MSESYLETRKKHLEERKENLFKLTSQYKASDLEAAKNAAMFHFVQKKGICLEILPETPIEIAKAVIQKIREIKKDGDSRPEVIFAAGVGLDKMQEIARGFPSDVVFTLRGDLSNEQAKNIILAMPRKLTVREGGWPIYVEAPLADSEEGLYQVFYTMGDNQVLLLEHLNPEIADVAMERVRIKKLKPEHSKDRRTPQIRDRLRAKIEEKKYVANVQYGLKSIIKKIDGKRKKIKAASAADENSTKSSVSQVSMQAEHINSSDKQKQTQNLGEVKLAAKLEDSIEKQLPLTHGVEELPPLIKSEDDEELPPLVESKESEEPLHLPDFEEDSSFSDGVADEVPFLVDDFDIPPEDIRNVPDNDLPLDPVCSNRENASLADGVAKELTEEKSKIKSYFFKPSLADYPTQVTTESKDKPVKKSPNMAPGI